MCLLGNSGLFATVPPDTQGAVDIIDVQRSMARRLELEGSDSAIVDLACQCPPPLLTLQLPRSLPFYRMALALGQCRTLAGSTKVGSSVGRLLMSLFDVGYMHTFKD